MKLATGAERLGYDSPIDEESLIGTREMVRDRLGAWRESGVTTPIAGVQDVGSLRTFAELALQTPAELLSRTNSRISLPARSR
jgi:hypothetical protein